MKPILACDIDGVLADCDGPLHDALAKRGYHYQISEQTHYSWISDMLRIRYGVEDPNALLAEIWWDTTFIANQPVILPMLAALRKLRGMANRLHMVTARNAEGHPGVAPATRGWLDRYGIPYDRLAFETDKAAYCREHAVDYLIEDNARTAQTVLQLGVGVFLIDRPYNQDLPPQGGLWRVHNPLEIPGLLQKDLDRDGKRFPADLTD